MAKKRKKTSGQSRQIRKQQAFQQINKHIISQINSSQPLVRQISQKANQIIKHIDNRTAYQKNALSSVERLNRFIGKNILEDPNDYTLGLVSYTAYPNKFIPHPLFNIEDLNEIRSNIFPDGILKLKGDSQNIDLNIRQYGSQTSGLGHYTQQMSESYNLFKEIFGLNTDPWHGKWMSFDTEWLGGTKNEFVGITEIATKDNSGNIISHLISLDKKSEKYIDKIISKLEAGYSITSEERRLVLDLMKYSTSSSPSGKGMGAQFEDGRVIQHANWIDEEIGLSTNLEKLLPQIKEGKENIQKFGVSSLTPSMEDSPLNQFMKQIEESDAVISWNALGRGSDIDTLQSYMRQLQFDLDKESDSLTFNQLEQWIKTLDSTRNKHVDMFGILSSAYKGNEQEFWKDVIGSKDLEPLLSKLTEEFGQDNLGYFKQEIIANILGIDTGSAHQAESDINTLSEIINKLSQDSGISNSLRIHMEESSKEIAKKISQREKLGIETNLYLSDSNIKSGDRFHFHKGTPGSKGIISSFSPENKILDSTEWHGIISGQEYEFKEYQINEVGDQKYYTAIFEDIISQDKHAVSFKNREEIAAFIHDSAIHINDNIRPLLHDEAQFLIEDKVRRSYQRMFNAEQSSFWRAEKFYKAAKELHQSGFTIDPSKGLSKQQVDLLKETLSWIDKDGNKILGPDSWVRDFEFMFDRLRQESDLYLPVLEEIKKYAQSDTYSSKLVKNHALKMFHDNFNKEHFGQKEGPTKLIPRPHSRRLGIVFTDPISSEEIELDFSSNRDPVSRITNKVYELANKRVAFKYKEKASQDYVFSQILNDLKERNYINQEDIDTIEKEINLRSKASSLLDSILNLNEEDLLLDPLEVPDLSPHENFEYNLDQALKDARDYTNKVKLGFTGHYNTEKNQWEFGRIINDWLEDQKTHSFEDIYYDNKELEIIDSINQLIPNHLRDISLPDSPGSIKGPAKLEEILIQLLSSYNKKETNISTDVFMQNIEGTITPVLVAGTSDTIAAARTAMLEGNINQARQHASILPLPVITSNGKVINGKINQPRISINKVNDIAKISPVGLQGSVKIQSSYEYALDRLNWSSSDIAALISQGKYEQAEKKWKGIINRSLESVSVSDLSDIRDLKEFDMSNKKNYTSLAKATHYQIDDSIVEAIIQGYGYDENQDRDLVKKAIENFVRDFLKLDYGVTYANHKWYSTKNIYGLKESDVRLLYPFGDTIDAANPRYRQFGNFLALTDEAKSKIIQNETILDDSIIPGTMTVSPGRIRFDKILEKEYGEKVIPGVTVKTAFLTDQKIREIFDNLSYEEQTEILTELNKKHTTVDDLIIDGSRDELNKVLARMGTYEERTIISQKLATLLQKQEEKTYGKKEGIYRLNPIIEKALQQAGENTPEAFQNLEIPQGAILGWDIHGEPIKLKGMANVSGYYMNESGEIEVRGNASPHSSIDKTNLTAKIQKIKQRKDGLLEIDVIETIGGHQGMKTSVQSQKGIVGGIYSQRLIETFGGKGTHQIINIKTGIGRGERRDYHIEATGLINKFIEKNIKELQLDENLKIIQKGFDEAGIKIDDIGLENIRFTSGLALPYVSIASDQGFNPEALRKMLRQKTVFGIFQGVTPEETISGIKVQVLPLEVRRLDQDETMRTTSFTNIDMDTGEYAKRTAVNLGLRDIEYLEEAGFKNAYSSFTSIREVQSALIHGDKWDNVTHRNKQIFKAYNYLATGKGNLKILSESKRDELLDSIPDYDSDPSAYKGTIFDIDATKKDAFVIKTGLELGPEYEQIPIAPSEFQRHTTVDGREIVLMNQRSLALSRFLKARSELIDHQNQYPSKIAITKTQKERQKTRVELEQKVKDSIRYYQTSLEYDATDAKGEIFSSGKTPLPASSYMRAQVLNFETEDPLVQISRAKALELGLDVSDDADNQYLLLGANPSDRSSQQLAKVEILDDDILDRSQIIFDRVTAEIIGRDSDGDQVWVHSFATDYVELVKNSKFAKDQDVINAAIKANQETKKFYNELLEKHKSNKINKYIGYHDDEVIRLKAESQEVMDRIALMDDDPDFVHTYRTDETGFIAEHLSQDSEKIMRLLSTNLAQADTGIVRNIELRLRALGNIHTPDQMASLQRVLDGAVQDAISGKKGQGSMERFDHQKYANKYIDETSASRMFAKAYWQRDVGLMVDVLDALGADEDGNRIGEFAGYKIEEIESLFTEILNKSGDKWSDPSLIIGMSRMVKDKPEKINVEDALPTKSLRSLFDLIGKKEADQEYLKKLTDIREQTDQIFSKNVPPVPMQIVDQVGDVLVHRAKSSAINYAIGIAATAAFGMMLPKMMGSSPLAMDQRPQAEVAPMPDGSFILPNEYGGAAYAPGAFGATFPTTLRVMPEDSGHKGIRVTIAADDFKNMSPEELGNIAGHSIQESTGLAMNMNMNVRNNSKPVKNSDVERMMYQLLQ